jgi:subtilisin family serine protease
LIRVPAFVAFAGSSIRSHSMLKRTYFLAAVGLAALCLVSARAHAASKDFETPEYKNSTGLQSLNASAAYDLGFTGKGVVVGVVDSYFAPQVGEFAGKYPYGIFLGEDRENHGIHVAGIIAASKDGIGMHGTAFDASLLPHADFTNVEAGWKKNPGISRCAHHQQQLGD